MKAPNRQPWARAFTTKGGQRVGIAAWENASAKPAPAVKAGKALSISALSDAGGHCAREFPRNANDFDVIFLPRERVSA